VVVDRGCPRVGVSRGELNVAQRNAGVERGHDERGAQRVRMHRAVAPSERHGMDRGELGRFLFTAEQGDRPHGARSGQVSEA
jgi:hypothetical protein